MTLIFKVNRQGQNIHFRFFDISDPKNVRIDTKIKSVPRLQPEITKVIQKGVWPWFSRSCNKDRIFSLSPLDSLTPKTYPYVIFSKNSYGKTKIQGGGGGTHPPLGVRRWIFTLGVRGLRMSLGSGRGRFIRLWRCCRRCYWESRPQEGNGIAQAWATWPEGALAPNGTMKWCAVMCRGHGVPEMVTPAMRITAVLLVF